MFGVCSDYGICGMNARHSTCMCKGWVLPSCSCNEGRVHICPKCCSYHRRHMWMYMNTRACTHTHTHKHTHTHTHTLVCLQMEVTPLRNVTAGSSPCVRACVCARLPHTYYHRPHPTAPRQLGSVTRAASPGSTHHFPTILSVLLTHGIYD